MSKAKDQKKRMYQLQAEICGALANPVRLHILDLLGEGELSSSQLLEELEIPKANLSQHLSVLKEAGILHTRKEGLFQYASLAVPTIREACSLVKTVLAERLAQEEKENAQMMRELKGKR